MSRSAELEAYMKAMVAMFPKGLYQVINDHGVLLHGSPRPKGVHKKRAGFCYANAHRLAMSDPSMTYCEGFATSVIPIQHAWCIDANGRVVDPTWKDPQNCAYIGIPFDIDYVNKTLVEQGVYGILPSPKVIHHLMTADPVTFKAKTGEPA